MHAEPNFRENKKKFMNLSYAEYTHRTVKVFSHEQLKARRSDRRPHSLVWIARLGNLDCKSQTLISLSQLQITEVVLFCYFCYQNIPCGYSMELPSYVSMQKQPCLIKYSFSPHLQGPVYQTIVLDKWGYHENICCGYSLKPLDEALLMSTHNICFSEK